MNLIWCRCKNLQPDPSILLTVGSGGGGGVGSGGVDGVDRDGSSRRWRLSDTGGRVVDRSGRARV